ncbi:hypothetical protein TNCV_3070771 [Trichonephila clavipes]|nr:hypothetical protein TNCV_3070771 [Trichonephila clavipes]
MTKPSQWVKDLEDVLFRENVQNIQCRSKKTRDTHVVQSTKEEIQCCSCRIPNVNATSSHQVQDPYDDAILLLEISCVPSNTADMTLQPDRTRLKRQSDTILVLSFFR